MADPLHILTLVDADRFQDAALLSTPEQGLDTLPAINVTSASNTDKVWEALSSSTFDIFVLEPSKVKGEFVSRIRKRHPELALVGITSPHSPPPELDPGQYDTLLNPHDWTPAGLAQALHGAVQIRQLSYQLASARQELDQRLKEFKTIRRASLNLTSSLELEPALDAILEEGLHLISADDAHIFLYQDGELRFGSALFEGNQQKKPFQNPREDGITATVARSGETIVVNDVMTHPIFKGRRWDGAIIGIPLKIKSEVQGVMNLAFQRPHTFTVEEQRALELLADQAAIAIHNARLYEKAQQEIKDRKRAEEALRESEERYRKLFDSSKDAIMTLEPPDWQFTSGNNAILDMFKVRDMAEFTSHGPGDLSPKRQPDGQLSSKKARKKIATAMEEGSNFFEWYHQRMDGEVFPATVLLTRVDLADKQFLQATVRDITERKETERSLKESEEKYRSLFERVPVGLYQTTPEGEILDANPALVDMLGYPDLDSLLGVNVSDIFVRGRARQEQLSLLDEEQVIPDYEIRLQRYDGSQLWAKDSSRVVKDETGKVLTYQGSLVDITERVNLQREVEERRQYLEGVLESTLSALITLDKNHRILEWNTGAEKLFGYKREEVQGQNLDKFIASPEGEILPEAQELTTRVLSQEVIPPTETVRYDKWGNPVPVVLTGAPIQVNDELVGIVSSYTDISKQKDLEKEIKHMATHDALTGLPNRRLFNERIQLEMAHAERNNQRLGVLWLDLDNFKEVNDTYGHSTGDILLQEIAQRLTHVLRKSDTVARMGGDEFIILLPEMEEIGAAQVTADRVLDVMNKPFMCDTHAISISFSIGISIFPDHGRDIDTLTKSADRAMYQAKDKGGNVYHQYSAT